MEKKDKVLIFDTTLRDGEQAPGASMNEHEKIDVAYALERLGFLSSLREILNLLRT